MPQTSDNDKEFQLQVLRKLSMLNVKLDQISSELIVFHETLRTIKQFEPELNVVADVSYNFPLENVEAVDAFENFLQKDDNYKNFVSQYWSVLFLTFCCLLFVVGSR